MSWPGYSSCGCSLSLHCLSQCPKPGIIGSGSTSEHVTTPRWAASIGTLQWNCTKKGYLNTWCIFLWMLIKMSFSNLPKFLKKYGYLEVAKRDEHSFCSDYLQCGLINKQQYMQWRERGLAFEMREGVYQMTNPSLLSSRVFSKVSVSLFSYMTFPHDEAIRWNKGIVCYVCVSDREGTEWLSGATGETLFPVLTSPLELKLMTRACWRHRMGNTLRWHIQ